VGQFILKALRSSAPLCLHITGNLPRLQAPPAFARVPHTREGTMQHLKKLLAGGSGTALDRLLPYRPALVNVAGSINAAIFLSQVLYWWFKCGRRPFYKFNAACEHELYRPGDSWQEELAMGRAMFETARDQVATKVTTGSSRKEILSFSPVIYWTDSNRVTWYQVNELLVWRLLRAALRIEADAPEAVTDEPAGELSTVPAVPADDQHYLETPEASITRPSETTTMKSTLPEDVKNSEGDIIQGREGATALLDHAPDPAPAAPPWWPRALQELRGQMTRATYEYLLHGATARDDGQQLVIVARDDGAVAHLQRWERKIREAIRVSGGGEREFRVTYNSG
jgi:hypothetical protein